MAPGGRCRHTFFHLHTSIAICINFNTVGLRSSKLVTMPESRSTPSVIGGEGSYIIDTQLMKADVTQGVDTVYVKSLTSIVD